MKEEIDKSMGWGDWLINKGKKKKKEERNEKYIQREVAI